MGILHNLSVLALRQLLTGACKAAGVNVGQEAVEGVTRFLSDHFTDHSQRLNAALGVANARAWKALEVALAGDSWWDRVKGLLARAEDQAFRRQVRAFLDATPLGDLPGHGPQFRAECLRELRLVTRSGHLTEALDLNALAERTGHFARFADPAGLVRADEETLAHVAEELHQVGYPTLARCVALRPPQGEPILVASMRYFFRRQVETDSVLFRGLAFAQMERLARDQEGGFAGLAEALDRHGGRLEGLLDYLVQLSTEVHGNVQEIRAALSRQEEQLRQVGATVTRALEEDQSLRRRAAADNDRPARAEQDLRLEVLNTLLKTPHRKLGDLWPVHEGLIARDPLFYVRLAAWYFEHGEVRDHREVFLVALILSGFPGHRDVGLALLRKLPPYQVARVLDFISGRMDTRARDGKIEAVPFGLFRNPPRALRTEVTRYLREREADPDWFDSTALVARKALKRLYALLHIKPGERAQKILFDEKPPADSRVGGLKRLGKAASPDEQARILAESRVPFRVAVSVLPEVTPATLEALIDRMSPQEVMNNLALLQRRGALAHPDLKALVELKLEAAKTDRRVSTFKADVARQAVHVPEEVRRQLEAVADVRLKARGRITRPTALLIDKSGSMETAIEVGKQLGAMISAVCTRELYAYAFDKLAYPIQPKGTDLASWQKAFAGITANGLTSCGVAVEALRRKGRRVEQFILVTDEEEYDPPYFVDAFLKYRREFQLDPAVCIVRVPDSSTRIQDQCRQAGIVVTTFDFRGDYYALPNLIPLLEPPTEMDLLMQIMEYPLPERAPA